MKLKFLSFLLLVCAATIFPACSGNGSASSREVSIEEKAEEQTEGIVLNDKEEEAQKAQNDAKKQEAVTEPTVTLADRSELVTMWDGNGGKTETRNFKGHPRLQLTVVRTAVNGVKQVIVYGYGKDVKFMNDDFAETALTGDATEIANAAELKQTKPYKDSFVTAAPTPQIQVRQTRPVKPIEPVKTSESEEQNAAQLTRNQQPPENENRLSNQENQN